jgi:glycosyltransferase involved in cell wall biosynthesis
LREANKIRLYINRFLLMIDWRYSDTDMFIQTGHKGADVISVCIPTYNGEKYIAQQLASILCQLSKDDEVIISDDSSTDSTISIIKSMADSRITILENQKFKSPIFNLENALRHAKGDLIFLSDQDDVWIDGKVIKLREALNICDCVISDARIVDADLKLMADSFFAVNGSKPGFMHNILKNGYLGACMAFNRKVLERSLPFPTNIPMHDIWIGTMASVCGKVLFLDDKLVLYRRHGNNASSTAERSRYSFIRKIQMRGIILWDVILRKLTVR